MPQAIRLLAIIRRPHSRVDGSEYDLFFEIGTLDNDVFASERHIQVLAQVSGTLEAIWSITPDTMGKIAATIALPRVLEAVREGREAELQTVKLNTYSVPHEPPQVRAVEGSIHPLNEPEPPRSSQPLSFLSDDISEVRDQINALAKSLWGDRVLHLSQERPLLDMYKSAGNQTEFRARIQSLGVIAKDFNRALLAKVSATTDPSTVGDFILLERALETLGHGSEAGAVTANLKHINSLRQGYPAHGDNADKFLQAQRHFNLPYPVEDYEAAWEKILSEYFSSMKALRDLLSQAWRAAGSKQ
jgi:hypothetical protein